MNVYAPTTETLPKMTEPVTAVVSPVKVKTPVHKSRPLPLCGDMPAFKEAAADTTFNKKMEAQASK